MPERARSDDQPEQTATSIEAVRERMGTEPMDPDEFEVTFGALPTDDEG
jgi:hypothetical protein